jgi:hypothetical protein
MIFRVTMKDPDTLHDAVVDAVRDIPLNDLDAEEAEFVREKRAEKIEDLCGRWFEYGEYLTVEIDTKAGTAIVIERGK